MNQGFPYFFCLLIKRSGSGTAQKNDGSVYFWASRIHNTGAYISKVFVFSQHLSFDEINIFYSILFSSLKLVIKMVMIETRLGPVYNLAITANLLVLLAGKPFN